MNMYLHELKSLRKSTIIWACALIALAVIYFSVYKGVVKDATDFKNLLGGYPASIRAMLGISLDNITTILGFYSMIFSFVTLCGAIQAMNYGVSILSKETRERTADFLLVKPVSRAAIVISKLSATLTMLFVTNVLYYAGASIAANSVKTSDYNSKLFFMISLTLFFIQIIFLAIGVVVSVIIPKVKTVLPASLGVVFGLYILGAIITTDENNAARFISPFKYFNIPYIINNASYETPYLIFGAVIVVVSIAASYIIYLKKDIHAVS